jgi:hypothetical protein
MQIIKTKILLLLLILFTCSLTQPVESIIQEQVAQLDYRFQPEDSTPPSAAYITFFSSFFLGIPFPSSYPSYKQCDSRWKSEIMTSNSICSSGSLITCISMILDHINATVGGGKPNPKNLNAFLKQNRGYRED